MRRVGGNSFRMFVNKILNQRKGRKKEDKEKRKREGRGGDKEKNRKRKK